MKTAAKVFIWIGMILQCFLIYPIVVGVLALQKINHAATSEELKTLGILTAFFCSPIGGILMLSIKDSDVRGFVYAPNQHTTTTSRTVVEKRYYNNKDKDRFKTRTSIIVLMALYACLLIFSTAFSGVLLDNGYKGLTYIPLIFSCIQIIAVIFFFFAIYNKSLVKTINFCLTAILILTITQIALSAILNYFGVYGSYYTIHSDGDLVLVTYDISGSCDWLWSIFGVNLGGLILVLISLVQSVKTKQNTLDYKPVKIKKVITTNNMEIELSEAKRLLDTNVITQEEHDRIRSSIISKYYF